MDRSKVVLLMLLSVLLVSVSVFVLFSTSMCLGDISLGKDSGVFAFWEIVLFVF